MSLGQLCHAAVVVVVVVVSAIAVNIIVVSCVGCGVIALTLVVVVIFINIVVVIVVADTGIGGIRSRDFSGRSYWLWTTNRQTDRRQHGSGICELEKYS